MVSVVAGIISSAVVGSRTESQKGERTGKQDKELLARGMTDQNGPICFTMRNVTS